MQDEPLLLRLTGAPALCLAGGDERPLDAHGALIAARVVLAGPQPRALIASLLYPGVDDARARANLRQRLLRLKTLAGRAWIDGVDTLQLQPGVAVEPLADGELLEGLSPPDSDELAAWLQAQRGVLQQRRATRLQAALQAAEAAQRLDDALALAARWVALEPAAEAPRRALARLHYLNHDRARALVELDRLDEVLRQDHGATPSDATRELRRLVESARALATAAAPASVALLRPPRLVGRDAELRQAAQALGEGRALLIVGEAGLGKSRLIAELLAARPGAPAVKAQAGDGGVPYATLARLLRRLLAGRPLPAPAPVLARVLPELRDATVPLPPEGARLLLQQAVAALLEAAAPPLVAVDDLHFADEASLELLQGLIDADPQRPWLLAQRPGEGPPAAAALQGALLDAGRLQPLALQPLPAEGVAALLRDLALPGLDAVAWAPRLHRHTGGNPLFVLETLKQLQAADIAAGRLPHAASVGALIERRLRTLGERALALARLAAIAGPDFGPALAEVVLQRPAIDLADAWAELEAAQVLRDGGFAHDLVFDAVLRSVPVPIARHLHGAVARHLAQADGAEPARVAAHWQAAGDDAAALPWLRQAAEAARHAMRRREEAAFLEQAAASAALRQQGGAEACRLLLEAFLAMEVAAGTEAALPLLDRALALAGSDAERARVLVLRATGRTKLWELEPAVEDGREALALAERAGEDATLADILSTLASALSMLGRHAEAAATLEQHWPVVERLPDPGPTPFGERALVLDNAGRPHEARPFHRRAIEIARARGLHSEIVIGHHNLAVSLIDTGELPQAAELLDEADALRAAHDAFGAIAVGWNLQAAVRRDLGQYMRALEAIDRMLEKDAAELPLRAPMDRLHRAWLWAHVGQWARALQDLHPDEDYAQLPPWVGARARQLRWRIAAERGQRADDLQARAAEGLAASSLRTMHDSLALDLAQARGDAPAAQALRAAAEADALHGLRWAAEWHCAALAAAAGDAARAVGHARACLARPDAQVPLDVPPGRWWHGLWQVAQAAGDLALAEAARAEGVAWIHRTLQRELAPPFHAAFRDAVPAHRALLAG